MKKETKNQKIDVRVTTAEKTRIREYAEAHDMTIGDLIRMALTRMMILKEEKEGEEE